MAQRTEGPERISDPAGRSRADAGAPRGLFGGSGLSLGRPFGIEVRVDWSLIIIFALITFNLGAVVFPAWHPGWSPLLVWGTALGAAILFFASVLAHEMSHALVAQTQGIAVPRITLFLFGGLAQMEREPDSPKAEFAIAIVGPVTSAVIGIAALAAGAWMAGDVTPAGQAPGDLERMFKNVGPLPSLLLWLGPVNLLLAIFNILPGFPLDGGRVFRAIAWRLTNDLQRATRWAAGAGRLLAWTLIVFGAMNIFSGALTQGLWLILIGWFLNNAARTSYEQVVFKANLSDVPVTRVMRTRLTRVEPGLPVERFVREHLMSSDQNAFPVERDGKLLGLIGFENVRKIGAAHWGETTVGDVMSRIQELPTVSDADDAHKAFEQLARTNSDQVAVVRDDHLEGLVRREDLLKWLSLDRQRAA